jgi:hypothetical protein
LPLSRSFSCFESIVETDAFKPCPLFVNIRLHATSSEITIPRDKPLFQVRPIRRECYSEAALRHEEIEGLEGSMTEEDWSGYRKTVRRIKGPKDDHATGAYAVRSRRRGKNEVR